MKIDYKKSHKNINLIFGLVWLVCFFLSILIKDKPNWTDYGWVVISITYLIIHLYQQQNKYLTIKDGIIKINSPFGKKLNLNEINRIKKFAGDYTLITDKDKLTINTQVIKPNELKKLNTELKKLNLNWE